MKNKSVAAILALLLGLFGIHKFYLKETGKGILYLLFCWTAIPCFWVSMMPSNYLPCLIINS